MPFVKRILVVFAAFCVLITLGCGADQSVAGYVTDGQAEPAESESDAPVICEKAGYTQEDLHGARERAHIAFAEQGIRIEPIFWEDQEGFRQLVEAMIAELGCVPEQDIHMALSSRRSGPSSCQVVTDLTSYDPEALYCGEGAQRGSARNCQRFPTDDCMNRNCWQHDRCYDGLVDAQGPICLWSDDTEGCDAAFHVGAASCLALRQCGFWCLLIESIAFGLDGLQEAGKLQGEACLYGGTVVECPEGALTPCDYRLQCGCKVGQGCYVVGTTGSPAWAPTAECLASGSGTIGASCSAQNDCAPGMYCVAEEGAGCLPFCAMPDLDCDGSDPDCPTGNECTAVFFPPQLSLCTPGCRP